MNITSWLVDLLSYARQTGVSSAGEPTYGAVTAFKGRVQSVTARADEEHPFDHAIYTTTAIQVDDRIWLPGASTSDANAARRARRVESSHDRAGGVTLYKVVL